jgi:hypothetical protein
MEVCNGSGQSRDFDARSAREKDGMIHRAIGKSGAIKSAGHGRVSVRMAGDCPPYL